MEFLICRVFGVGDTLLLWVTEQACCERAKVHDSPMVGVVESNRMSQRSPILFVVRSRNIELMFTPKSRGYTVVPPHIFFLL